jgi:UPF0716 protein FxsA
MCRCDSSTSGGYTTRPLTQKARTLFRLFFTIFLLVPLIEIYLLIKVGGTIGALPTVFLVVFTAVLGALLLRHQGLYTYAKVQQSLAHGELPTMAMLEGLVLLICGALLLTPGFFTDTLGFLGLIPPLRKWLILKILEGGVIRSMGSRPSPFGQQQGPQTLDGEYRRIDDD